MSKDSLTLYKLIILDILSRVDFPLTNAQVSDFILEKEYADYFEIQQALSELIDSELILRKIIRNSTHYNIKNAGKETLDFFGDKIPDNIKDDIYDYLKKNKYSLREEASTISDYVMEKEDNYIVRCQVKERGSSIIDLSLSIPTEKEAKLICDNWKSKSQEVYLHLIKTLMRSDS